MFEGQIIKRWTEQSLGQSTATDQITEAKAIRAQERTQKSSASSHFLDKENEVQMESGLLAAPYRVSSKDPIRPMLQVQDDFQHSS